MTGAREDVWPEERMTRLRALWEATEPRYSAKDIAAALGDGLTRSAIIGKASRMGLSKKGSGGNHGRVRRPARERTSFNRPANPKPEPPKQIVMTEITPVNGIGLTLIDPEMTSERCHAVVTMPPSWGELARYCGLPVFTREGHKEAESYCHGHYEAFHRELPPRVR